LVRKNAITPRQEEEIEIVSTAPSAKVLNRLRRGGKQAVGSDVEDEAAAGGGGTGAASRPRTKDDDEKEKKRKKKKKPILTHKVAAKFGIFDTEAINSEASGSEASSESYDSENSIDRDFVARDDDDDNDVGGGEGHTFYRDSLNTQHGGGGAGGAGPVFEDEPEWVKKRNRWANPENWGKNRQQHERRASMQDTPRSQEPSQWR
jgi:hypothetical protein